MFNSIVVVVVVLLLAMVHAQRNPSISFISKDKVVNIGDTLELKCQVQDSDVYPVSWTILGKPGKEQIFVTRGRTVVVPGDRHHLSYDERDSTYTLVVNKVQEIDAGTYRCEITTSVSGSHFADVPVYVRIPPVISDNSTRSVITTDGTQVTLQCYGSGYPQPKIGWRREKYALLPDGKAYHSGNNLTIKKVTKDSRGTYYCIADNGVGSGARRHISVEVEFQPQVRPGRLKVEQALQYDADLHCHVEAFPSPAVVWLKDGQIINDNQHYKISIFAREDEFIDSTLRVKRIEKRQYGSYSCRAMNKLGSNSTMIDLIESVNVICPPACGVGYNTRSAASSTSLSSSTFIIIALAIIFSSHCLNPWSAKQKWPSTV